jgi:Na+-transporting NADH:ubiquinone oxidoreductase subunit NqrD
MRSQFYKERHFMYFLCITQNVRVMKTNLMHYLSSVYFVNQLFRAYLYTVYIQQSVRVVLFS